MEDWQRLTATTNGGGLEDWKRQQETKRSRIKCGMTIGGVRDDTTLFLSLETLRFCVTLFLAIKGFTDFNSAVAVGCNQRVSKFLLRIKHLPTAVYINESEANGT